MPDQRHVKIVLPCANEREWLRVTVDSILEHTDYPSYEIAISANGDHSTDFSFLEKPAYRQRVRLVKTDELLGVGNARNVAVTPGDAAFYVFLDAHCLLERDDWLTRGVACLEAHPDASMVQPEVMNFIYHGQISPGEPVDRSRMQIYYLDYSTIWAWPYRHSAEVVETIGRPTSSAAHEGMAADGMATFVRAETFHRLGKFDPEAIGWHHESMDYCIRAWLLGHPMLVDPSIRVFHRVNLKMENYVRSLEHVYHSALRTAYKYLSPRRRDLAELLYQAHAPSEAALALQRVRQGNWLSERVEHLKARVHDDDWLFARFRVHERRFTG